MTRACLDPDLVFGLELLAAVQGLPAGAAPIVSALVRDGCLTVPNPEALLAALDALGQATLPAGAEAAMLAAWRAAQGPHAPGSVGDPAPWQALVAMELVEQAQAAIVFAMHVTYAGVQRAASGDMGPILH